MCLHINTHTANSMYTCPHKHTPVHLDSLLALLCLQQTITATSTPARATTVTVAKNKMAATTAATVSLLFMIVASNWVSRPSLGEAVGSDMIEALLVMNVAVVACGNAVGCSTGVGVAAGVWGPWVVLVVEGWDFWDALVVEGLGCALVLRVVVLTVLVLEKGTGSEELLAIGGGSVLSMPQLVTMEERDT